MRELGCPERRHWRSCSISGQHLSEAPLVRPDAPDDVFLLQLPQMVADTVGCNTDGIGKLFPGDGWVFRHQGQDAGPGFLGSQSRLLLGIFLGSIFYRSLLRAPATACILE